MCGRIVNNLTWSEIVELYQLTQPAVNIRGSFNLAPTQELSVVRRDDVGEREYVPTRWGLVPFWAKDVKIGVKMINARSETVGEKPAFRNALKSRRCLIPVSGFSNGSARGNQSNPITSPAQTPRR